MKRGYIVLIAGSALLIAGIIITSVWAVQFAGSFMKDNTFVGQTSIDAGKSLVAARIDVRQLDRPVSLAIGIDRTEFQQQQQPPLSSPQLPSTASNLDTRLKEEVTDPTGKVVSSNEFGDSIFTSFDPEVTGIHTVTISNLGTRPVTVSGAFGHMPFTGHNGNLTFGNMIEGEGGIGRIIAGGALVSIGIVTLIVGAIITVADSRKRGHTTHTDATTEGGITYRKD